MGNSHETLNKLLEKLDNMSLSEFDKIIEEANQEYKEFFYAIDIPGF